MEIGGSGQYDFNDVSGSYPASGHHKQTFRKGGPKLPFKEFGMFTLGQTVTI